MGLCASRGSGEDPVHGSPREGGREQAPNTFNSQQAAKKAFIRAAMLCDVAAMQRLLDHSTDPAAMILHTRRSDGPCAGFTALMWAAISSRMASLDAMRLLLDHPSADPAAMLMHGDSNGTELTALMITVLLGNVDAMRLLLDHPSADPAAMMVVRGPSGTSALKFAAMRAAGSLPYFRTPPSCAPLLLLLRRVAAEPQPSDDQQAHMSMVMEALRCDPRKLLDDDKPDDARDECVRLLFVLGARGFDSNSPVVLRIIRESLQLASVPHLINEAVVGLAIARR
jgi:hypothetical protein